MTTNEIPQEKVDALVKEIVNAMPDVQLVLEKCEDAELLGEAAKYILVQAMTGKINKLLVLVVDDLICIRQREIKCGKICIHSKN